MYHQGVRQVHPQGWRVVEWAERRIVYLERQIGVNGVDVDRSDVSSGCEAGPSSGVESG